MVFLYPIDVGEQYLAYPGQTRLFRLMSKGVQVTVPAGTFTCYEYLTSDASTARDTYYYVVPQTGLVQIQRFETGGRLREQWSLTRLMLE